MQMLVKQYQDVRDLVQPGDVIAFGGFGFLSHIVKAAGGSNVSHTGAILEAGAPGGEPRFIESTVDFKGAKPITHVKIGAFRDRVHTYAGEVWWLPLAPAVRAHFKVARFVDFMRQADGQPFDIPGGLWVTLRDLYQRVVGTEQESQFESYFCSELVAKAFESAGLVKKTNGSNVSPTDLCRWKIYEHTYYHLRPDLKTQNEILGYNTRPPGST